jgi:hypothetical protein
MPPLLRAGAIALACAWLATPVGAEVYRWRDASGREHFAQQLHQVPAEHRAAAKAAAADAGDSESVSFHAVPRRSPTDGARSEGREARAEVAPPAMMAPGAGECRAAQKEVARQEKVIRTHRGSVEANQRWADDIDRSAFSRRKYEVRAEEEARWLARAEEKLERYVDSQRRKGLDPGCLR